MSVRILIGDVREKLRELPDESVQCIVTSPPYYGLRDYGVEGQIGLEATPNAYIDQLVAVFAECRRVLKDDGTLWLNLGDSYNSIGHKKSGSGYGTTGLAGGVAQEQYAAAPREHAAGALKHKDLMGIPWRVAFALQADGWWLRSDIIWSKPNPMPESVTDRPTSAHEHIFLLAKSERYYFDNDAVAEDGSPNSHGASKADPGAKARLSGNHSGPLGVPPENGKRNRRNVWTISPEKFLAAHYAVMPNAIAEICIKAGCPPFGTVLDPFGGAGTTGLVADRLKRNAILTELNPEYAAIAERRIKGDAPMFAEVAVA